MPTIAEMQSLIANPVETLAIEYKGWLDLTQNHGRATLAKAAIALANTGGGIIVLGMAEAAGGGAPISGPRPEGLARYTQDIINASIARFSDPEFHCELHFCAHPQTGVEHAFAVVPGGAATPIMSARGCEGVIEQRRCYIRKPGPRSEEPTTADEWNSLLARCLAARREGMLDAIRLIVQGHQAPPEIPGQGEALRHFSDDAHSRWEGLIEGLPHNDPGRFPLGGYEFSFQILGGTILPNLNTLRTAMEAASRIKHTGWGPFVMLQRQDLMPHAIAGSIQAWLGGVPAAQRLARRPSVCDFWRASPAGLFYLARGYDEDGLENVAPGEAISISLPVWRLGEALLYIARIANSFGENPRILCRARYTGLQGRRLGYLDAQRDFFLEEHVCADHTADLETVATVANITDNLAEVLHAVLSPLYERFGFFELETHYVAEEVTRLRSRRY